MALIRILSSFKLDMFELGVMRGSCAGNMLLKKLKYWITKYWVYNFKVQVSQKSKKFTVHGVFLLYFHRSKKI